MGMARGLGDGLLRFCNGAWRDNDGDAVDIVEVVRCKDCKHWRNDDGSGFCTNPDGIDNYAMYDDFCSYGERKDNES